MKKLTLVVLTAALLLLLSACGSGAINMLQDLTSGLECRYNDELGGMEITGYNGNTTIVNIPKKIYGQPVVAIADRAFQGYAGLTSVTIPNSVTSIGEYAFQGCSSLTSLKIPKRATNIGAGAFQNCAGLKSMTIPNGVTEIGDNMFYGCMGLTSVTIPNSVTKIGEAAFGGCSSLTGITIPNGVTSISRGAFFDCAELKSITIPDGVTEIGPWAFQNCRGLTSLTIPKSVTSIGEYAFYGCTGTINITISDNNNNNGAGFFGAFNGFAGQLNVTISDGVTEIGDYAFHGCAGLTSITIPNSVMKIGNGAFWGCTGLTELTIEGPTKAGGLIMFGGILWRVLDVQSGKALIISEGLSEWRAYHWPNTSVTWEDCTLRQYLNGEFYDNAFSAAEKARIVTTQVKNNSNPWWGTSGGNDTTDKIFLLSIEEMVQYFGDSGQLAAGPTGSWHRINDQYNSARAATTSWWLRSPGGHSFYVAFVFSDGYIEIDGLEADRGGCGVRPALWITLEP